MIATDTYTKTFSEAELYQATTLASLFKTKLFLDWFNGIKDFMTQVDRTDTLQQLQGLKASDVQIEDWSPLKLEGMHSLALEKAMRIRYSGYDTGGLSNVKDIYAAAAQEATDLSTAIATFEDSSLNWTTQ